MLDGHRPRARRPANPAPEGRKPRKPRRDQFGKSARLAMSPCTECNIVVGVDTLLDKFAYLQRGARAESLRKVCFLFLFPISLRLDFLVF
jgi:hypothetical protein